MIGVNLTCSYTSEPQTSTQRICPIFSIHSHFASFCLLFRPLLVQGASPGGGMVDAIAAFRHRWKLNPEQEALHGSELHPGSE